MRYSVMIAAVCCLIAQYAALQKFDDIPKPEKTWERWYFRLMAAALLGLSVFFAASGDETDSVGMWKELAMLSLLCPLAFIDYRTHLIPNRYLLMGLAMRVCLLVPELAIGMEELFWQIASEACGCLALFLFCMLMRVVSRGGLGMGDVKLFTLMPLFLGFSGSIGAVFYALLVAFVQSCVLLLSGKKGKKDTIAFAPAIMAGTWIYIILSVL